MWKPYKITRYSTHPSYKGVDNKYSKLCKNCGYPYGKHYGTEQIFCVGDRNKDGIICGPVFPFGFPKEFYTEELNINTKVI